MERYSEYLKEVNGFKFIEFDKEEVIKDLHVVIIGLSDDEGTFADLMQSVAKKKALKVNDFLDALELGTKTNPNVNGVLPFSWL